MATYFRGCVLVCWLLVGPLLFGQTWKGTNGSGLGLSACNTTITGVPSYVINGGGAGSDKFVIPASTVSILNALPAPGYWNMNVSWTGLVSGGGPTLASGTAITIVLTTAETTLLRASGGTITLGATQQASFGATVYGMAGAAWSFTANAAGAVTSNSTVGVSTRLLPIPSVTNNTGSLGTWAIFQFTGPDTGVQTGVEMYPETLSPGGVGSWNFADIPNDGYGYAVGQVDLSKQVTFSDANYQIMYGASYLSGTLSAYTGVWAGSGMTAALIPGSTVVAGNDGGDLSITLSGLASMVPGGPQVIGQPVTVIGSTVTSAGGGTLGPGSGGATDNGLQNNANIIDSGIAAAANSITGTLANVANGIEANDLKGSSAIIAQLQAGSSGGGGGGSSTISNVGGGLAGNVASSADVQQLHADLTTGAFGAANSVVAAGTGAIGGEASGWAASNSTAVSTALGGAGLVQDNAAFNGPISGLSYVFADTLLGTVGLPDQPFGTITLDGGGYGRGGRPVQFTLSMSSSAGGVLQMMATRMNLIMTWVWVAWYIFAVQTLVKEAVTSWSSVSGFVSQSGPETQLVLGGANLKVVIMAGVWIAGLATAWGLLVGVCGSSFLTLPFNITGVFGAARWGSSLGTGTWGANLLGWLCYAGSVDVAVSLLAMYWGIRWQIQALILSVASLLKFLTA